MLSRGIENLPWLSATAADDQLKPGVGWGQASQPTKASGTGWLEVSRTLPRRLTLEMEASSASVPELHAIPANKATKTIGRVMRLASDPSECGLGESIASRCDATSGFHCTPARSLA